MNWLIKLSGNAKPMSLPSYKFPPSNIGPGPGVERIDESMSDETANKLKGLYPGISFMGAGSRGIVYDCGGAACKITKLEQEAENAMWVQEAKPEGSVEVYSVEQIQEHPALWLIKMKKVRPLDTVEAAIYSILRSKPLILGDNIRSAKEAVDIVRSYNWVSGIDSSSIISDELISKIFIAMLRMSRSLISANLNHGDAHSDNIGWDGDKLVLVDLE
jgi:hypothetical protein